MRYQLRYSPSCVYYNGAIRAIRQLKRIRNFKVSVLNRATVAIVPDYIDDYDCCATGSRSELFFSP
jgi:hypothetical protein